MFTEIISPTGGHPDLCFHKTKLHYAFQDGGALIVSSPERTVRYFLGTDVLAFPRVVSALNSFWVLYREGKSLGGRAVLLRDFTEVWRSDFEIGGNFPLAFGMYKNEWVFAYRNFDTIPGAGGLSHVFARRLNDLSPLAAIGATHGTGIARIEYDTVISWDENFGSLLPEMTNPHYAGALVVGEHPIKGALVLDGGENKELLLFPGQWANTPRLAASDVDNKYACMTWGPPGVRLAVFSRSELLSPNSPYPPGRGWNRRDDITTIDLSEYLFTSTPFCRTLAHFPIDGVMSYTHLMQNRVASTSPLTLVHEKELGTAIKSAVWIRSHDTKFWGLAWDETDGKNGYRIVLPNTTITAPLYPNVMSVGQKHMRSVNVDILTPDGNRRNVTWRGHVEAVWDGPKIGDIPPVQWANIIWDFNDPTGFREENLCARHHGPAMWFETKKTNSLTRRWFGVYNAPRMPSVPIPPVTPPPGETMLAPKVDIRTYSPVLRARETVTIVDVVNGNKPDERVVVSLVEGSLHVQWTNSAGSDRSAKIRPVET